MENVFFYFVAIGAGVSLGLSLGAIPALLAIKYFRKGDRHDYKTKKTYSRS